MLESSMHSASHVTENLPLGLLPYDPYGTINPRTGVVSAMSSAPISRPRVLCFSRDRVLGETRSAAVLH